MIRNLNLLLLALVASLMLAVPSSAQSFPERGKSPVVDQAHLLRPEQVVDISSKSEALFARTGRRFVVATVNSLEGRAIEDYGYRLGRYWQLGDEQKDDGVILLVAPKERKVRIETGYGARVFLTDAVSSVIINETIIPRFKANDYGGGIVAGTDAIIQQLELPPAEAAKRAQEVGTKQAQRGRHGAGFLPVVFIVMIFFMVIGGISRGGGGGRRYRGRRSGGGIDPLVVLWGLQALSQASRGGGGGWGGGGFGGGGGGFGGGGGGFSGGGGSFGGGGAGGSW